MHSFEGEEDLEGHQIDPSATPPPLQPERGPGPKPEPQPQQPQQSLDSPDGGHAETGEAASRERPVASPPPPPPPPPPPSPPPGPPPVCYYEGALNSKCVGLQGAVMPLGDNTATSGECYNFFASVGRAGYVNIGSYGTSYPKGCWYQGTTRYFNTYTGTSGSHSQAKAICKMSVPYYEGAKNTDCPAGTAMSPAVCSAAVIAVPGFCAVAQSVFMAPS